MTVRVGVRDRPGPAGLEGQHRARVIRGVADGALRAGQAGDLGAAGREGLRVDRHRRTPSRRRRGRAGGPHSRHACVPGGGGARGGGDGRNRLMVVHHDQGAGHPGHAEDRHRGYRGQQPGAAGTAVAGISQRVAGDRRADRGVRPLVVLVLDPGRSQGPSTPGAVARTCRGQYCRCQYCRCPCCRGQYCQRRLSGRTRAHQTRTRPGGTGCATPRAWRSAPPQAAWSRKDGAPTRSDRWAAMAVRWAGTAVRWAATGARRPGPPAGGSWHGSRTPACPRRRRTGRCRSPLIRRDHSGRTGPGPGNSARCGRKRPAPRRWERPAHPAPRRPAQGRQGRPARRTRGRPAQRRWEHPARRTPRCPASRWPASRGRERPAGRTPGRPALVVRVRKGQVRRCRARPGPGGRKRPEPSRPAMAPAKKAECRLPRWRR